MTGVLPRMTVSTLAMMSLTVCRNSPFGATWGPPLRWMLRCRPDHTMVEALAQVGVARRDSVVEAFPEDGRARFFAAAGLGNCGILNGCYNGFGGMT